MKPLTITFCTVEKANHISGVDSWIKNISKELIILGHRPHFIDVTHGRQGLFPLLEFAKKYNISVDIVREKSYRYTEAKVRKFLEILKSRGTDVFIPGYCNAAYYTIPYLKKANIPTVVVLHSDDKLYKTYFDEFVLKKSIFRADAVVAVSDFLYSWTENIESDFPKQMIGYGVDVPKILNSRIGDGKLKVVYSGRLAQEQKRIKDVFESFKLITNNFPGIECCFIGDGPEKTYIKNKIKAEGKNRIQYAGSFDSTSIQTELFKYDVLVLLSDYEGLPLTMLEAMACGLVVICLKIDSGVDQLIKHKENGLIVENRHSSFNEAIEYLIQNPEQLKIMGNAARETVINQYSSKLNAEKWISFLQDICTSKKEVFSIPDKIMLPNVRPHNMRDGNIFERDTDKILEFMHKVKRRLYLILRILPDPIFENLLALKNIFNAK